MLDIRSIRQDTHFTILLNLGQGIPVAYLRKNSLDQVTQNALAARNNEAYGQGNCRQLFCTVLHYGLRNFVIGRFQTRARNGLSV